MSAEANLESDSPEDSAPNAADWFDDALPKLFGYSVTRVGGRVPIAEDLTQETVLAAVASRHPPRSGVPVMAWLYGIARHKLVDFYRREGRERKQFDRSSKLSELDTGPSPPLGHLTGI